MSNLPLSDDVRKIAETMERYEATESRANTGTGTRREGAEFQVLVLQWWTAVGQHLAGLGASRTLHTTAKGHGFIRLAVPGRSVYLPAPRSAGAERVSVPDSWFATAFSVSELVGAFPGEPEAIDRYAPTHGPFAGQKYPEMFSRMTTGFDGTIVLEEGGCLREKILLEYKTAKSSKKRQIDGNAHERLSFQVMQYLEAATRYTRCSFVVLANGAFVFYRNKYHVSFRVQADRLSNFAWFHMEHICTHVEYEAFAAKLVEFLFPPSTREKRQ